MNRIILLGLACIGCVAPQPWPVVPTMPTATVVYPFASCMTDPIGKDAIPVCSVTNPGGVSIARPNDKLDILYCREAIGILFDCDDDDDSDIHDWYLWLNGADCQPVMYVMGFPDSVWE